MFDIGSIRRIFQKRVDDDVTSIERRFLTMVKNMHQTVLPFFPKLTLAESMKAKSAPKSAWLTSKARVRNLSHKPDTIFSLVWNVLIFSRFHNENQRIVQFDWMLTGFTSLSRNSPITLQSSPKVVHFSWRCLRAGLRLQWGVNNQLKHPNWH